LGNTLKQYLGPVTWHSEGPILKHQNQIARQTFFQKFYFLQVDLLVLLLRQFDLILSVAEKLLITLFFQHPLQVRY
jgi:hypothetical protein